MNCIGGRWLPGSGGLLQSHDPSTGNVVWSGQASKSGDVNEAIAAAQGALTGWRRTAVDDRALVLSRFADQLRTNIEDLTRTISLEVGKPSWEARTEVEAMIAKIPLTIGALRERRPVQSFDMQGMRGTTRYRPHGAIAVFGPFNFPGHIANGHIAPALLAGNTVVFKPSELTPLVAEKTVRLWEAAGLPQGVLNLVQGGRETGEALVAGDINGVLFTGSVPVGIALQKALAHRPDVLLALELGGNNPLIVHEVTDIDAAVYWTIQSAYITSGQRCTCARRLIVTEGNDEFLRRLIAAIGRIRVGLPDDEPQPFMGPLIHSRAVDKVLWEQQRLVSAGAKSLVACERLALGEAFVSPGLIDVTDCLAREDAEVFGPLLQAIRVEHLELAIEEANRTRFGLVAGLFSDSRAAFDEFSTRVNAGLLNWNRPTTGASGRLPFGGVGLSGNHRPAGYFMIDSCNTPIATLESERLQLPTQRTPGVE